MSFLGLIAFLFFNDYGLLKYFRLKNEIEALNIQIVATDNKIKELSMEIDSLLINDYKIEKVARERYMMLDENEKAIQVEKSNLKID